MEDTPETITYSMKRANKKDEIDNRSVTLPSGLSDLTVNAIRHSLLLPEKSALVSKLNSWKPWGEEFSLSRGSVRNIWKLMEQNGLGKILTKEGKPYLDTDSQSRIPMYFHFHKGFDNPVPSTKRTTTTTEPIPIKEAPPAFLNSLKETKMANLVSKEITSMLGSIGQKLNIQVNVDITFKIL